MASFLTDMLAAAFAAAMAALGPFEPRPALAAGVSGGADSMALAVLADDWVKSRGGSLLGLVVDHGLRPDSGAEARLTVARLAGQGIQARLLTVTGLTFGASLAARAREARYRVLAAACAEAGILHLLLGHHAADQAETMMLRVLSGSGGRGLAAMQAVQHLGSVRLLRPLLGMRPNRLRVLLNGAGVAWVEDPSNVDIRASRPRLRHLRGEDDAGTQALWAAARLAGHHRAANDRAIAVALASRVTLRPEGFALLSPGPIAPEALAELLRTIAGAAFAPGIDQVAALAANPHPHTVWGVRMLPAGRLGEGLLIVREEAALAQPVPARDGAIWDGRYQLRLDRPCEAGTTIGALGPDASGLRRHSNLPSAVLRTIPALRRGNILAAVPHLRYRDAIACLGVRLVFKPSRPLASAPFAPT